jgi:hypothetical protein
MLKLLHFLCLLLLGLLIQVLPILGAYANQ